MCVVSAAPPSCSCFSLLYYGNSLYMTQGTFGLCNNDVKTQVYLSSGTVFLAIYLMWSFTKRCYTWSESCRSHLDRLELPESDPSPASHPWILPFVWLNCCGVGWGLCHFVTVPHIMIFSQRALVALLSRHPVYRPRFDSTLQPLAASHSLSLPNFQTNPSAVLSMKAHRAQKISSKQNITFFFLRFLMKLFSSHNSPSSAIRPLKDLHFLETPSSVWMMFVGENAVCVLTFWIGVGEEAVPRHLAAHRQRQKIVSGLNVDDAVEILLRGRTQDPCRED